MESSIFSGTQTPPPHPAPPCPTPPSLYREIIIRTLQTSECLAIFREAFKKCKFPDPTPDSEAAIWKNVQEFTYLEKQSSHPYAVPRDR